MIRWVRRLSTPLAIGVTAVVSVAALVGLWAVVDGQTLRAGVRAGLADPRGLALGLSGFGSAFMLRAVAWSLVQPGLSLGHSLAAIHVSLGGNHVLPLRLGEPLRVISVIRRAGLDPVQATASTVALRAADIVSLLLLGLLVGPVAVAEQLGPLGLALCGVLAAVGLAAVAIARSRRPRETRTPVGLGRALRRRGSRGLAAVAVTTIAWCSEAVLVWQVLRWFGVDLSVADSLIVLAVAVASQVLAVTPGGVGTYEAVAGAALVGVGVDPSTALAAAVTLHALKTLYSVAGGLVALGLPRPALLGNVRLPRRAPDRPASRPAQGPVLLFLPAYNEAPRIERVIRRAPDTVAGRPVEVVVIDDGSTDDTTAVARAAGATVIQHGVNRGLGAAVRTGLRTAVEADAAAIAFCDADGEYDPTELARLVRPVLDGTADYVVGSRFAGTIRHMRPHRRLGNLVLTAWVRWTVRAPVTDGQSGYRAFSPSAAQAATIPHDYNYAQVLTIDLLQSGFVYHEVPIDYHFRESGTSFVRLGRYLSRVLPTVWRQLNPVPLIRFKL